MCLSNTHGTFIFKLPFPMLKNKSQQISENEYYIGDIL